MSDIASGGFRNEDWVAGEFNGWEHSHWGSCWLAAMGHGHPTKVCAQTTRDMGFFYKADVLVLADNHAEWVSVKKFNISFNQIDKRWVSEFAELWNMPRDVTDAFRMYCGEEGYQPGDDSGTHRDARRYMMDELDQSSREAVLKFLNKNKKRIIRDVIAGRGRASARWMLLVEEKQNMRWRSAMLPIDTVVSYCMGDASITNRGNLRLGKVTIQRKGGDNGRKTAQMLQFKFSPRDLFETNGAHITYRQDALSVKS